LRTDRQFDAHSLRIRLGLNAAPSVAAIFRHPSS
jgi:hypothetical protein